MQAIQQDSAIAHKKEVELKVSDKVSNIVISLKNKNQGSITLIHNPVFYFKTKYINIQNYYIHNEITS